MYTKNIEGFELYTKTPNEIHFGSLYTKIIEIPCSKESERTLRVWLPEDYDDNKRYEVIYMTDGQNIVDAYTSGFGEWNMEDHIHNLQNKGLNGYILVGIDCPLKPKRRMEEYSPYKLAPYHGTGKILFQIYGIKFAKYIVEEVKPLIDRTFKTIPESSGFAGSSMGGLFSFYISTAYPEIFKFALVFSPAICLIDKNQLKKWFESLNVSVENFPRLYLYGGCKDKFESKFARSAQFVYDFLISKGFTDKDVGITIDKDEIHHESAWSKYVEKSLLFVNRVDE